MPYHHYCLVPDVTLDLPHVFCWCSRLLLLLRLVAEANVGLVLLKISSVVNVVTVNTKNSVGVPTFGNSGVDNHRASTETPKVDQRARYLY